MGMLSNIPYEQTMLFRYPLLPPHRYVSVSKTIDDDIVLSLLQSSLWKTSTLLSMTVLLILGKYSLCSREFDQILHLPR